MPVLPLGRVSLELDTWSDMEVTMLLTILATLDISFFKEDASSSIWVEITSIKVAASPTPSSVDQKIIFFSCCYLKRQKVAMDLGCAS